jgi:multidrug efflux system membrane fusion protein
MNEVSGRRWRWIAVFVVVLAVAAVAVWSRGWRAQADPAAGAPPPPAVTVAEVQAKPVQLWDEFVGRVTAVESVELRPRVSGYIERVNYVEGDEVKKGDVLFVIDQRSYRAELARVEAEVARAESTLDLARKELVRAEGLAKARAISSEEADQRRAAVAQAEAALRAARADVDVARLEFEFTEVRAPISGRAGHARVTAGNLAQANATLLTTLVSLDPVHVYFEGDERTWLRYGEAARNGGTPGPREGRTPVRVGVATDDGYPYRGYVDFVDNRVDPATGTIRARAVLDNRDRVFTPGLFARVQLLGGGDDDALLIDPKAVLTDQDRKYVYVLDEQNRAQRRDIVLGRQTEGQQIVASGLAPGDLVIVNGVQKIFFPGMPVQPQGATVSQAAPAGEIAMLGVDGAEL